MADRSKNKRTFIVSESVPPISVIKVTTSETMRLGSPDKIPRQPTVPSSMLSTPMGQKKKASSFQITSVTESVTSKVSVDGGDDSADDLEDSRTEDISDTIDISKLSLDLQEPISPFEAVNFSTAPLSAPPPSDEVFVTNAIPSPIIPSAEGHYGIAIVSTEGEGVADKSVGSSTVNAETVITFPVTSKSGDVTADLSQWQNRFKIVKIERTEPYKRGRWECMDFSDQPAPQAEVAKLDGAQGHSSSTLVNGSPTGRVDSLQDGTSNPQSGSLCHPPAVGNFAPSVQHAKSSPLSTPSLPGVVGKVPLGTVSGQILTSPTPTQAPASGLSSIVSQGIVQCGQSGSMSQSVVSPLPPIISSVIGGCQGVHGGAPQPVLTNVSQSPVTYPQVTGVGAQMGNAQVSVPTVGPTHGSQAVNIPVRPLPAVSTSNVSQPLVKNASCNTPTTDFCQLPQSVAASMPNKDFQSINLSQQSKVTVTSSTSVPIQSTGLASVCLPSAVLPLTNQPISMPHQTPQIPHPSSGVISSNLTTDGSYSATGSTLPTMGGSGVANVIKSSNPEQGIGHPSIPVGNNTFHKESEEGSSADQAHLALEVTLGEISGGPTSDDPASVIGVSDDTECLAQALHLGLRFGESVRKGGPYRSAPATRAGTPLKYTGDPDKGSASGSSTVAIDNKIEQAMDLVKSHLMFAVREEVEVLKEKITELSDRINQLEHENTILRSQATQETLSQLCSVVSNKPLGTNSSSNPTTFDGRL